MGWVYLPDFLALAALLYALRDIRSAVLDSIGQGLKSIADLLGAGGVVDGVAHATTKSAYDATYCARNAADGSTDLENNQPRHNVLSH